MTITRTYIEVKSSCSLSFAGSLCCLMALFLLLSFACSSSFASIYVCRDKNGTKVFTNVPNGGNCKAYSFRQTKRNWSTKKHSVDRAKYDREILRSGKNYNVDPRLIKAIIHTESDFDHRAVSRRGAQGLMQLMPETARELRVANPFDPGENIDGGTRYFRRLLDNFNGDLILSLAAYNAGPGRVMRTGGVPQIPETLRYVNKVLKQYRFYKTAW